MGRMLEAQGSALQSPDMVCLLKVMIRMEVVLDEAKTEWGWKNMQEGEKTQALLYTAGVMTSSVMTSDFLLLICTLKSIITMAG